MGKAAAEWRVAEELGALRVMLARLLGLEGEDPLRLAHGMARVADVALPAARAQLALDGEDGDEVARTFARVLAEMDAAAKAGRRGPGARWDDEDDGWTSGVAGTDDGDGTVVRGLRDSRMWEDGA